MADPNEKKCLRPTIINLWIIEGLIRMKNLVSLIMAQLPKLPFLTCNQTKGRLDTFPSESKII